MDLKHVINPESIAVVGASDRKGSFAFQAAENALASDGAIYFVNPSRSEVLGRKCYAGIADLPETPECVVLCTPQSTNLELLEEAGRFGVKGAVLFASGFEDCEAGVHDAKKLEEIAAKYDMTVIGPNGIGLVNYKNKKAPWTMGLVDFRSQRSGGIAVVCQSGMMVGSINAQRHIPMSYGISVGNCTVVKLEQALDFFADDEGVEAIGAYIEGVSDPELFVSALEKARKRGIPVVALKSGKHPHTAKAARYHTANIHGDYDAYIKLMEDSGVILVSEVEEFALTLKTVHALGSRLGKLSSASAGLNGSGGLSIVSCDLALDAGLSFPDFLPETASALRAAIPEFATVLNPLDYTTAMKGHEALLAVYKAIAAQTNIHLVYTGIKLSGKKEAAEQDQQAIDRYAEYAGALGDGQALFLMTPPAIRLTPAQTRQLADAGAYSIPVGSQGFRLMGRLGAYAERLRFGGTMLAEDERRALLKSL
ncbi:MAG: CoA-binding protein [Clostridiales Family XIII bacterium]|jgi:acetyltransferase|nr:CoA-binding protein [Clostridiales Family XIII bacterium]